MYAGLIGKLFNLQIIHGDEYQQSYMQRTEKMVTAPGTRGNIYDRNGKLLAYNELAYSVTIQDLGDYPRPADRNAMIYRLVTILERRGEKVEGKLGIAINEQGEMYFTTTSKASHKRFLLNFYGISSEKLDDASGRYPSDITAREAFELKKSSGRDGYNLNDMKDEEGNPLELTDQTALDMINIIYTMKLTEYQKYESTTVATNVSRETMTEIHENAADLKGVSVEESYIRVYNDSLYFSPIIGYTGKVQEEQVDRLNEQWREEENKKGKTLTEEDEKYNLNDVVGRIGIEQYMELDLQGEKGYTKMYVDNMGRPREVIEQQDAKAGNDVYLTIDKNLQVQTYKLLEEKLAGIVRSKLRNVMNYDPSTTNDASEIIIPVDDAYNAFIANEILDETHFGAEDAKPVEKAVHEIFVSRKESAIQEILAEMNNPSALPYKELSKEMQAYMDYVCDTVLTKNTEILNMSAVDTSDEIYLAWAKEETININQYLNYAISKNWISTSKLSSDVSSQKYSDSGEIYQGILKFLEEYLRSDVNFDKLLYKYLIKSEGISGAQICAMVYEQGVLPMDEAAYNGLNNGSVNPYTWLCQKIENLEITPGQLALEPCTGSAVVSDPNTGEVLACVSYPGYDNNRLSNTMDSNYYNQLVTGLSRPFYNNATQERTAPGSTYKMLTAVAGLTEGTVTGNTTFYCTGVFDKITPNPKCWIYPGAHGYENVVTALRDSCNDYFYNIGYAMGMSGEEYDSDKGTDTLAKYAKEFGLDEKSGVEIPESEPQISDEYSVQSAIGQGTNNYTVSQLNRYVAAVADRGTVHKLTLLDKTTDVNGKVIKEYEPEVTNTIEEVSDNTWNLIHQGMIAMVQDMPQFNGMEVSMAGKTGTAQQSEVHPDHVLFVGFAPAEKPEIAIAVRIANGYNSAYTAEIGRDIVKTYYQTSDSDKLITGKAAQLGAAVSGD